MPRETLSKVKKIFVKDKKDPGEMTLEELLVENNELLRRNIRANRGFWQLFYGGIIRGLGTAVGATLVVSLVIAALKPLAEIGFIEPLANEIIEKLDQR